MLHTQFYSSIPVFLSCLLALPTSIHLLWTVKNDSRDYLRDKAYLATVFYLCKDAFQSGRKEICLTF
jgi:hypothetical protein